MAATFLIALLLLPAGRVEAAEEIGEQPAPAPA